MRLSELSERFVLPPSTMDIVTKEKRDERVWNQFNTQIHEQPESDLIGPERAF